MGKIRVVFLFLFFVLSLYAKLDDELNLFSKGEKIKIENRINEFSRKKGTKVFVNTLEGNEGFAVEKAEKTIILNISRISKDKIETELKFSKDLDIEEYQENIDNLLEVSGNLLQKGKIGEYVLQILDQIEAIFENVEITEPIVIENETHGDMKSMFFKGMLITMGIILILFLIAVSFVLFENFQEKKFRKKYGRKKNS